MRISSAEYERNEARDTYFLLVPVVLFFLLFQYYPILKSVIISFTEYGLLRKNDPFYWTIQLYPSISRPPLRFIVIQHAPVCLFYGRCWGRASAWRGCSYRTDRAVGEVLQGPLFYPGCDLIAGSNDGLAVDVCFERAPQFYFVPGTCTRPGVAVK